MKKRRLTEGSRFQRTPSDRESTRADEDRSNDNREHSDSVRLDAFRQALFQASLPDIPPIPGYHVCWLSTNTSNSLDQIPTRMSLGYVPVQPEDVPGYHYPTLKSGDYEGCIGVNEMIAFKVPMEIYEAFMREFHHDTPNAEEEKLIPDPERFREQAAQSGVKRPKAVKLFAEAEIDNSLGQVFEPPSFARLHGEG